ncbi:MAG: hypothetical protein K0S44_113 [Bacteroidetes bacterium]|jgi:hypothetical protein|nr:hypothetical protein [Bacteroidota bacterium]
MLYGFVEENTQTAGISLQIILNLITWSTTLPEQNNTFLIRIHLRSIKKLLYGD